MLFIVYALAGWTDPTAGIGYQKEVVAAVSQNGLTLGSFDLELLNADGAWQTQTCHIDQVYGLCWHTPTNVPSRLMEGALQSWPLN